MLNLSQLYLMLISLSTISYDLMLNLSQLYLMLISLFIENLSDIH